MSDIIREADITHTLHGTGIYAASLTPQTHHPWPLLGIYSSPMEGLVNGSTVTGHVPRGERTPGLLLSGAADDRRGLRTDRQNGGAEDRNGVGVVFSFKMTIPAEVTLLKACIRPFLRLVVPCSHGYKTLQDCHAVFRPMSSQKKTCLS